MSAPMTDSSRQRFRAERALAALRPHRSDHQVLAIQCQHSHHLAAIYATGEGFVYQSQTGPHAHGSKDFIDTGRHGSRGGGTYVDLLFEDPLADDLLPAWCDCGPRFLHRSDLRSYLDDGLHVVHLP